MTRHLLVAIALCCAATGGCKRKKNLDGRLDELEVINGNTCACKRDAGCLAYQHKMFIAWNMRNDSTDNAKATPAQRERYGRLYHANQVCTGAEPEGSNQ